MPAAPCTFGKAPVDPVLFYKKVISETGCSGAAIQVQASVRIEPWAIIYTAPPEVPYRPPTCSEEIISVFRRSNVIPKLYYRAASHAPSTDCSKVNVRKITAWGPSRKEFTQLMGKMEGGIKDIRSIPIASCRDFTFGLKDKWTRAELDGRINRERITTTALTILNGAAFNSYICV